MKLRAFFHIVRTSLYAKKLDILQCIAMTTDVGGIYSSHNKLGLKVGNPTKNRKNRNGPEYRPKDQTSSNFVNIGRTVNPWSNGVINKYTNNNFLKR